VGAEFAPIRDLTFRGQYQRAIRAPNVDELFGGLSNGFPPATDPCSDRTPAASRTEALRALCIATGVPAGSVFTRAIQPADQIEAQFGGNPNLKEETADTYTFGAVFRPTFIPRLNITLDYYNIKVEDYIETFGGGLNGTLDLCYNVFQDASSAYCQAIVRNPSDGTIGGDFLPAILNANIATLETAGYDLQVDYSLPLDGISLMGGEGAKLNFFFLGTYTQKYDYTPVADNPEIIQECAGRFGIICVLGQPVPKYKWTSRFSLIDGPLTASLRWRHVSSVRDDDDATDYVVEKIGAADYFDLSFAFDVNKQFSLAFGVNNLFDKEPDPVGDNQEQSNTYPNVYDVLGRDFFVSASLRF
jgi:outer membrane receptor protein involved in Fe transport